MSELQGLNQQSFILFFFDDAFINLDDFPFSFFNPFGQANWNRKRNLITMCSNFLVQKHRLSLTSHSWGEDEFWNLTFGQVALNKNTLPIHNIIDDVIDQVVFPLTRQWIKSRQNSWQYKVMIVFRDPFGYIRYWLQRTFVVQSFGRSSIFFGDRILYKIYVRLKQLKIS